MQNSYINNLFFSKKYFISWLFGFNISNDIQKENNIKPPEINIIEKLEEGLLKHAIK
jgi:hypothetical protein